MTIYQKATAMKIIVSPIERTGLEVYSIQVLDGTRVVHTEEVEGKTQRDATVWRLADLYDTPDIELKAGQPKVAEPFKFSEIPSIPVLQENDADQYFEDNQEQVYDRVVLAVSEGINTKRDFIRLFELNGTGVYITSQKDDWKSGLKQAHQYFLASENYEQCGVIKKLLTKL